MQDCRVAARIRAQNVTQSVTLTPIISDAVVTKPAKIVTPPSHIVTPPSHNSVISDAVVTQTPISDAVVTQDRRVSDRRNPQTGAQRMRKCRARQASEAS